jgi:hypothetical protein
MATDRAAWLARHHEEALDPDQPIVDAHHHLWDDPGDRYLLEDLRADTGTGHAVMQTVFVECAYGYRADGPEALRPVGETERVAAHAAAGEGTPGPTVAGIVGFADLRLGDAVEEVLAATSRPAAVASAASATRRRGTRATRSATPTPLRRPGSSPTPASAPVSRRSVVPASASTPGCTRRSWASWSTWPGGART